MMSLQLDLGQRPQNSKKGLVMDHFSVLHLLEKMGVNLAECVGMVEYQSTYKLESMALLEE